MKIYVLIFFLKLIILVSLKALETLNRISKTGGIIISVLVVFIMGLLDYLTGYEISFSIFYLIPIVFLVWRTNKTYGIYLSILASFIWFIVDRLTGINLSSNIVNLWNALVRLGFFIMGVYFISILKKSNIDLENIVKERTSDLTAEIQERRKAETELKLITEKLRKLTTRIQTIREEENAVIAREIHDELGQALTAIKIDAAWLAKRYSNESGIVDGLINISSTVDETIKTVRKISTSLRPRLLDELGLIPAVEWQLKEYQKRTGVKYDFIKLDEDISLNGYISTALFRVFQEALTNISRHANADHICIKILSQTDNVLQMVIKDNGIGLPNDYMNKDHSLGIVGMIERTNTIGGHFEIRRAPEGGTEIKVSVPLSKKQFEKI